MPGAAGKEGGQDGGEGEVVNVGFLNRGKASVEVIGDFLAFHDADGGRELAIKGGNPVEGVHGEIVRSIEVGHLAEGVDAGIGAARAVNTDGFLGDGGDGFLNAFLNGVGIGLDLPAAEGCAVIGNGEFEVHGGSAVGLADCLLFGKIFAGHFVSVSPGSLVGDGWICFFSDKRPWIRPKMHSAVYREIEFSRFSGSCSFQG